MTKIKGMRCRSVISLACAFQAAVLREAQCSHLVGVGNQSKSQAKAEEATQTDNPQLQTNSWNVTF